MDHVLQSSLPQVEILFPTSGLSSSQDQMQLGCSSRDMGTKIFNVLFCSVDRMF